MAPPRLPAEFDVNELVATVVARLATASPPATPVAELFRNVEVPKLAEPVPMPPGAAKAKVSRSAPPPPMPDDAFRWKVVPVTVRIPVEAVCRGADGVK